MTIKGMHKTNTFLKSIARLSWEEYVKMGGKEGVERKAADVFFGERLENELKQMRPALKSLMKAVTMERMKIRPK